MARLRASWRTSLPGVQQPRSSTTQESSIRVHRPDPVLDYRALRLRAGVQPGCGRASGVRRSAEGDWLMMRLTLGFADEVAHIAVERAIAEFRTSRPVLIEDGAEAALTVARVFA